MAKISLKCVAPSGALRKLDVLKSGITHVVILLLTSKVGAVYSG
ncbi:hypothetical protein [Polaribacter gochangensis]